MRVAYICADAGVPVFGTKGCSVHVQEIIGQFLKSKDQVTLFAVRTGGRNCFLDSRLELREFALERATDVVSREKLQQGASDAFASQLNPDEFDLVYERYSLWSSAPLLRAQQLGIPSVLEVNAPLIEEQKQHRELKDLQRAVAIRSQVFEAATCIIAVSDSVAEYIRSCLPEKAHGKVHVVTNGVDTDRFTPEVAPIAPNTEFTIGFLGTIKPWHGLESLLAAFHFLHTRIPAVRLRIIGDGPMRENLQGLVASEYAAAKPKIDWIGAVQPSEVPGHLTAIDVAVAPYLACSDFYFSPLKVYEYMAAGRAIVASSIGQLQSVITQGVSGMLYPPGDVASLADVLCQLVEQPEFAKKLGRAARTTAVREHSWRQTLATILKHVQTDKTAKPFYEFRALESTLQAGH